MMSLIQPGGGLSPIRGGRGHGVRHDPRGVALPEGEKKEDLWEDS